MPAVIFIVFYFREHIIHDSDREQIKLREGHPRSAHVGEERGGVFVV